MERNPHFDRETINEDITITYLHQPPWSPQQEWGDVGGGGEFTGWKAQEDPPSYKSDWQDYPADEFTGIQSHIPSGGGWFKKLFDMYGGNLPGLGGKFETPYEQWQWRQDQDLLQKRKYDKHLEFQNQNQNRFNPEPGPWNEFNPSDLPHPYYPGWDDEVISEDLMAELSGKQGNWMEGGLGNPNWFSNFEDYYNTVTGKGDWKQKLGLKDKATEQEVIDKLNQMMQERNQSLPWPVV